MDKLVGTGMLAILQNEVLTPMKTLLGDSTALPLGKTSVISWLNEIQNTLNNMNEISTSISTINGQITSFEDRLDAIEQDINDIKDRLTALESIEPEEN